MKFSRNAPLLIVQSPTGAQNGEPFTTQLSNVPRARNKEKTVFASDWDYLNQALKEAARPKTNQEYGQRLIAKGQEKARFFASVEWSWHCNPKSAAFFQQGDSLVETTDTTGAKVVGCDRRYYQARPGGQGGVEKVNGVYPLRIQCECGASVRAFANLRNFRPVENG